MISLGRIVLSMEINQGKTFSFVFEEKAAMVYGLFFFFLRLCFSTWYEFVQSFGQQNISEVNDNKQILNIVQFQWGVGEEATFLDKDLILISVCHSCSCHQIHYYFIGKHCHLFSQPK